MCNINIIYINLSFKYTYFDSFTNNLRFIFLFIIYILIYIVFLKLFTEQISNKIVYVMILSKNIFSLFSAK